MNKSRFLSIIKNPQGLDEKSLLALEELAIAHPYCQAIHVLIAKGYDLLSKEGFEKKLNHAAVYASDRKHLKAIIVNDLLNQASSKSHDQHSEDNEVLDTDTYSSEYLQKEITSYLEKLRKERTALDLQDIDDVTNEMAEEKAHFKKDLDIRIAEAEAKLSRIQGTVDNPKNKPEEEAEEKEENTLLYDELEENLIELRKNKALISEPQTERGEEEEEETAPTRTEGPIIPLSNNVEKEKMEEYLASLKTNEAKIIENEKVREQIKIIDSFIENQPKLPKLDHGEEDQEKREDLSLRSSQASANIASENLAMIMAKQGKLQKAEEIYNKLIWKYPEKKAYFVARINELKKK